MPLDIDITKTLTYKEGKLEGKLEGKIEGKIENKFETAEIMLSEDMPIVQIQKVTGFSVEQINEIKAKMKK